VCQEFGCTPSEADRQDVTRCRRIMRLRRFSEAWQQIEDGVKQDDLTKGPMLETALKVNLMRVKGVKPDD